jgi:hypothetical protein
MNPTMPQEFESLCLMIEMGFYYKDSSKYTWNNFDELTAKVIESALSGRDRAGLFVIKNYLNRLRFSTWLVRVSTSRQSSISLSACVWRSRRSWRQCESETRRSLMAI